MVAGHGTILDLFMIHSGQASNLEIMQSLVSAAEPNCTSSSITINEQLMKNAENGY